MKFEAVIFDLDGTLLNSLDDLAEAANGALQTLGFPTHERAAYRYFVGEGVKILFQRALPDAFVDETTMHKAVELFKENYSKNWNKFSRPYDGIKSLLQKLHAISIKTAVLSNKPHDFTQMCVKNFFETHPFQQVRGMLPDIPAKPDPQSTLEIAEQMNTSAHKIIFVGDTSTDMQTAVNAGMFPCGVSWGFRPIKELKKTGARTIIHTPEELLKLLDK